MLYRVLECALFGELSETSLQGNLNTTSMPDNLLLEWGELGLHSWLHTGPACFVSLRGSGLPEQKFLLAYLILLQTVGSI